MAVKPEISEIGGSYNFIAALVGIVGVPRGEMSTLVLRYVLRRLGGIHTCDWRSCPVVLTLLEQVTLKLANQIFLDWGWGPLVLQLGLTPDPPT